MEHRKQTPPIGNGVIFQLENNVKIPYCAHMSHIFHISFPSHRVAGRVQNGIGFLSRSARREVVAINPQNHIAHLKKKRNEI